jgi:hypothetical protein
MANSLLPTLVDPLTNCSTGMLYYWLTISSSPPIDDLPTNQSTEKQRDKVFSKLTNQVIKMDSFFSHPESYFII